MPEQILTFKPGETAKLIGEGKMTVVSTPSVVEPSGEPPKSERQGIEKAKQLFEEDFLGEEAIHIFEEKCRMKGINVQFEIPQVDFSYSESDIEQAKQEEAMEKTRMAVLRPEWMIVKEGNKDTRKPVTILNLRDLFKKETRNLLGVVSGVTYDNNPFGEGTVFYKYSPDWYATENFAKEQLKAGYALPTKEVLPGSTNRTWDDQEKLFEPGEHRREANEAVWDTLLHYAATGRKNLERIWDRTNGRTSYGDAVYVAFRSDGLRVGYWFPGRPRPNLGVCSSR